MRRKLVAILFVLVVVPMCLKLGSLPADRGSSAQSAPIPRIESIHTLSMLTVVRVNVADVIETELRGYTGGVRVLVIVKGDLDCGVDLAQARSVSVEPATCTAVVSLPSPQLEAARVDHRGTRIAAVWHSGLWVIVPGGQDASAAAIEAAFVDAERAVAAVADDAAVHERARRQAEQVVRCFFEAFGWHVEVQWR